LARLQKRRFSEPDEVRPVPNGQIEVVWLDDRVVGRIQYEPGWRWSKDVKPIAATSSCQFHHFGITLSGRLRAQMQDGVELEVGPGEVFELPPGHDAWVVGDEPWVSVDFEAMRGYARSTAESGRRSVATIMLTDIVDSTGRAVAVGPSRWREILSRHNEIAERIIDRHEGRLIKTTGDGVIAVFDGAERAVRAAAGLAEAVRPLDIHIRAGVHTGEVDQSAGDVRGVAVHAAARISALADPDSVLVSSTVRDLADGSSLEFKDHGLHVLKGLPGERQLFRYVSEAARGWRPAGER
jgi:class 3 adenylate cyclase